MTLRQKKLLEELPKNNFNILRTAKNIYASSSAKSTVYTQFKKSKNLQEKIRELYDPQNVKLEINEAKKKFIKDDDNNNYARMIELQSKISIPELRRQEILNTNPDKIVIIYQSKNIENPSDTSKENTMLT